MCLEKAFFVEYLSPCHASFPIYTIVKNRPFAPVVASTMLAFLISSSNECTISNSYFYSRTKNRHVILRPVSSELYAKKIFGSTISSE